MIIYNTLGMIFGLLIIFITTKIPGKLFKYLTGAFLFMFLGVIASSILYGDMIKRANKLIEIREEVGMNVDHDRFIQDRISKWNGTIYGGELVGMIAAYFYFRKKNKDAAKKQDA